jgi:hypothetical protein
MHEGSARGEDRTGTEKNILRIKIAENVHKLDEK